jgi:quercetin dioxygenase-like cupin family protein
MTKETGTTPSVIIPCDDLSDAIDFYTRRLRFKLDVIMPADSPTSAILHHKTNKNALIRLDERPKAPSSQSVSKSKTRSKYSPVTCHAGQDDRWMVGRAGMEYRDLIPGRMDGKVIASHIRLTADGAVADYVHYHKVGFQMIYCLRGRIKVVYQDQGPPFWLEAGDCVLQPPEIRHRVLESRGSAEVIEIGMPAEHETWVEHDIKLPTSELKPERVFGGQRFVRHIASGSDWIATKIDGVEVRDTGITQATGGMASVQVLRTNADVAMSTVVQPERPTFFYVISGDVEITTHDGEVFRLEQTNACIIPPNQVRNCKYAANTEVLEVFLPIN